MISPLTLTFVVRLPLKLKLTKVDVPAGVVIAARNVIEATLNDPVGKGDVTVPAL